MKNNPINILFFIPYLGHGGAEKVLVNMVNNLDKKKYRVTIQTIFNEGENRELLNNDINYVYRFSKPIRGYSHFLKLFSPRMLHSYFVKRNYDIEVAFLEGVSTRIISGCPCKNTKLISWVHCTFHNKAEACEGYRSFYEAQGCYSRFHRVVCVSKEVESVFNNFYAFQNKTITAYNVNESSFIRDASKENAPKQIFNEEEFNICATGKIVEVKGFDRLACIQNKLIKKGYNTHIYILGIGEQQREIEKYIKECGLEDRWTFLGYKANPYSWMANSDLFVCSSRSEGLSTAVTEALIVGTPVITTEVSGMHELLENGKYGLIVNNDEEALFEGICSLIDNPDQLNYYKRQAGKRGNRFAKEQTISEIEEIFDAVLIGV